MPFIAWKPEFSVGIAGLDDDHRHLIALLNESQVAMDDEQGRLALRSILEGLIWYTRSHFRAEEVLMQTYAYPKLASHKAEHDRLTNQVIHFADGFKSGVDAEVISVQVATMLEEEWLAKHILQCDAAYAQFFRSNGIMDAVIAHANSPKPARKHIQSREHDWLRHGRVAAPHW